MPARSESSTEDAPMERIKRIKDIAATRKEEKGKPDLLPTKQPSFNSQNNKRMESKKKAIEIIREGRKVYDDEEFSRIGVNVEDKTRGQTKIRYCERRTRYEPSFLQKTSILSDKPRWNSGTNTSQITNNSYLYGEPEPVVNFTRKKSAAPRKDRCINQRQLKSKQVANSDENSTKKIPTVKSSVLDDKSNQPGVDRLVLEAIPRHISDPTLLSKRCVPSTKIHRERCSVFKGGRPDTPTNKFEIGSKYQDKRARILVDKANERRKMFEATMKEKANDQSREDITHSKIKTRDQVKKIPIATVADENKENEPRPSRIPVLSKTHTVVNSSLGLNHSRYFRDSNGQQHVVMRAIPEMNEPDEEIDHAPTKKASKSGKGFSFFKRKSSQKK